MISDSGLTPYLYIYINSLPNTSITGKGFTKSIHENNNLLMAGTFVAPLVQHSCAPLAAATACYYYYYDSVMLAKNGE